MGYRPTTDPEVLDDGVDFDFCCLMCWEDKARGP